MRGADLTIAPDARAALVALIGGDRLASRNEIRKLALYAAGKKTVELADVLAVVSDASDLALDGVIDATFAGDTRLVESEFGKARAGGSSPAAIVSAAIRQVANLHKMKLAVEGGDSDRMGDEARRAAGAFHPREGGRRRPCAPGRRRGCCAPWRSSPRPRSRRGATRRWPRRSRSARC